MDKLDIILWAMGGGFAGTWALLFWNFKKIEKLDEKLTDVDRRLCRLEGAFSCFSSREICGIRTDSQMKKAE